MFHIFHHNDADGRCAAAIMVKWHDRGPQTSDIVFHEVDYKSKIDIDVIKKGDKVAVVDFSFLPETMAKIRERADEVIWCDHHVTAKEYGYDDLAGYRDFSKKGLSGCECTWKFCFPDRAIPRAVELIGDYDSWRMELAPACLKFYEGIKTFDTQPFHDDFWSVLLNFSKQFDQDTLVDEILWIGKSCIKYRNNYCKDIREGYGYNTFIDGHTAFATNMYHFGSQGFGEKFQQYPVCIAYIHDGKKFTVSLYSETVDVSEIAKKFGGGGHKGAAGFVCEALPFKGL